jgi:galactokinase
MGVVYEMLQTGSLDSGFDMTISGDIPLGAGLSSSAALECAAAFAINTLYGLEIDRLDLVRIGLRAERHFVGLDCGIMDQYASFFGKQDSALLIDCMNETHRSVSLNLEDCRFLLINSMVVHDLADSPYNVRRGQCEEGVKAVRKLYPHVRSLREVSMDMLDRVSSEIDEVVYNRCAYVIRENERVLKVVDHLDAGALAQVGSVLYAAHEDMRRHYDVTCPETDFLVELAAKTGKVIGARQTGGGFGGCTINMVPADFVEEFKSIVSQSYQSQFGKKPEFIPVRTSNGVSQIPLNDVQ